MAAIVYDTFLLLAVQFFATAIALPVNEGKAFSSDQILFSVYLVLVSYLFFGWFWTHGGQTLGMRAWKVRLVSLSNNHVTWRQAGIRFCTAALSWSLFGLGFIWCFFDRGGQSWHDRVSNTRLISSAGEKDGSQK